MSESELVDTLVANGSLLTLSAERDPTATVRVSGAGEAGSGLLHHPGSGAVRRGVGQTDGVPSPQHHGRPGTD